VRILAGIPTRLRNTSGKIAQTLATVVDDVFVVSQGAEVWVDEGTDLSKIHVQEYPENFGVIPARNEILRVAFQGDYDIVIQSDDDISFREATIRRMIEILDEFPTIGAITSESRAYFNWNKDVRSTRPFLLTPCAAQLWAARVPIMREIGLMEVPYLEDREHGCRLWKSGYPVVELHETIDLAHNPFISRTNVSSKIGGQNEEHEGDIHSGLKAGIEEMNLRHGDIVNLKYLGIRGRSFTSRYNWPRMIEYVDRRFGKILGYADSKGRVL